MQICTDHWEKLRIAVKESGMWHLVSHDGQQAAERIVNELNGEMVVPDPLMNANFAICAKGVELGGMYLMYLKPDGTHLCPLCELNIHVPKKRPKDPDVSDSWIKGCVDFIRDEYIQKGWFKLN